MTLTPLLRDIVTATGCHVEDAQAIAEAMRHQAILLPVDALTAQQVAYVAQRIYRMMQAERTQEVYDV